MDADRAATVEFVRAVQPEAEGPVARVLDAPWYPQRPNRGALLCEGDRIVGYLTAIYSERAGPDGAERRCCLGSWFVLPEFRARSLAMMQSVLRQPDLTFVAVTPNATSVAVLTRFRFEPLDEEFLLLPPLAHLPSALRGAHVHLDEVRVRSLLGSAERVLWEDHTRVGCVGIVLEAGSASSLILGVRRTLRRVPVCEILYLESPTLVRRHLERVKLGLMAASSSLGVTCDPRLFQGDPPRGVRRSRMRLYRSDTSTAYQIDNLYSELAVL
jgi:hypothetical protein